MFAEVLHIRPWEIGRLTVRQFRRAVAYIDDRNRRIEEANRV